MFKKSVMKSVVLAVSLIHALPTFAEEMNPAFSKRPVGVMQDLRLQARGGDFGAGNGSDGLELSSGEDDGDVVVPVPGDVLEAGEFQLLGVPGAGQNSTYTLYLCQTDAAGNLVKYGCDGKEQKLKLNASTPILPGTYLLFYSGMEQFIQIRANEKVSRRLKKLQVAKASRPVEFKVFIDLTDSKMQELAIKSEYIIPSNRKIEEQYCQRPKPSNADVCQSIRSSADWRRAVQFNPDGSYSLWDFGSSNFGFSQKAYVTDPDAGQFVSVLPGVYGIEFTDKQIGKTQTQLGIRVE